MLLSDSAVHDVFMKCLFAEGEDTSGAVLVGGVTMTIGMHPGRLAENRETIRDMLMELPTPFRQTGGGGWSFVNACMDRHDRQWTDYHTTMQELFVMGEAAGLALMVSPREMWPALPGGMPYYAVLDKEPATELTRPPEPFKCACGRVNCELVPHLHRASACRVITDKRETPGEAEEVTKHEE